MENGYNQEGKVSLSRMKRLKEMAQLYQEGWTKEELIEESGLSRKSVERDIQLMKQLGLIEGD